MAATWTVSLSFVVFVPMLAVITRIVDPADNDIPLVAYFIAAGAGLVAAFVVGGSANPARRGIGFGALVAALILLCAPALIVVLKLIPAGT